MVTVRICEKKTGTHYVKIQTRVYVCQNVGFSGVVCDVYIIVVWSIM